jgi:hypothetical protein
MVHILRPDEPLRFRCWTLCARSAIDMVWAPLFNRWAQRTAPEYADRLVETALDGLCPRGRRAD